MFRLTETKPPFALMPEQQALAFIRRLRADRRVRKIRPADAKAAKRLEAKKLEGLVTKLVALPEADMDLLFAALKKKQSNDS